MVYKNVYYKIFIIKMLFNKILTTKKQDILI